MKFSKLRIGVIGILVLLLVLTGILPIINLKKDKNKSDDVGDIIDNNSNISLKYEDYKVYAEEGNYNLTPTNSDSLGVDVNSDFKIISKDKIDINKISQTLEITPNIKYDIEKLSNNEALINIKDKLETNAVYSISLQDEKLDKKASWAFQTKRKFKILGALPYNANNVPLNTGIEIRFSHSGVKDIENYFEITPKVEGRFEHHKNTVVFIPERLYLDTSYKVTIKKGLGVDGSDEKLDYDYSFEFLTQSSPKNDYFTFTNNNLNIITGKTPYLPIMTDHHNIDKEVLVSVYKYKSVNDYIENISKTNDYNNYYSKPKLLSLDNLIKKTEFKTEFLKTKEYGEKFIELPDDLSEGYYLINALYDDKNYQMNLQINDISTYIMLSNKEVLVWANDGKTGEIIENAKVNLNKKNETKTNNEGIGILNINDKLDTNNFVTITRDNKPPFVAKLELYRNDEETYDVNRHYYNYMFLDRGAYLPSDTINVWGYIKPRDNEEDIKSVTLYLYKNGYGNYDLNYELDKKVVSLSEIGTYTSKFDIGNLSAGGYYIKAVSDDKVFSSHYFNVTEYKKPMYKLNTSFSKDAVFANENVNLYIEGSFYDGTPASDLELNYIYYMGEGSKNGNLKLDKNGILKKVISFDYINNSWRPYTINYNINNAKAEDAEVRNWENIRVFPHDRMLRVLYDENNTFKIETNKINLNNFNEGYYEDDFEDIKGNPIDTDVNIDIYEINYDKEEIGERYDFINKKVVKQYRYNERKEKVKEINVTTINGIYEFNFDVKDKQNYKIVASIKGSENKQIIEELRINKHFINFYKSDMKYYELKNITSNNSFEVGETASYKLVENSEDINIENGKVLYLKLKDGLYDYNVSNLDTYSFEFTENMIPNIFVKAIYFDGENIYSSYERIVPYNPDENKLDIDLSYDKVTYNPGDIVNLDIKVTDKDNNPVKSDVNISIVDEAFFSLYNQYVNTLDNIYKYNYSHGILYNYLSYKQLDMYGNGAEGGGEGDAEYIRSDFKDTAIFKSITTDNNGYGNLKFKLPDNLTDWRITYQAISDKVKAGSGVANIKTSIPFFVVPIMSDIFIEGDTVYISARVNGSNINNNDEIEYTVDLEKDSGKKTSVNLAGLANDYTNIYLGKLEKGKYTVTIKAKNNSNFDAIQKNFEVVDSALKVNSMESIKLNDNLKLQNKNNGYVNLKFFNSKSSLYLSAINKLSYQYGERVDQKLARKIGNEFSNKYFEKLNSNEEYNFKNYQQYDGGISLLPYSSSDVILSAKIAMLDIEEFDKLSLGNYFYRLKDNKESTLEEIVYSYLGLAALKEPVLLEIKELIKNTELNLKEKLILGIALSRLGDYQAGEEIYIQTVKEYGKVMGDYLYINAGTDKDDYLEHTSIAFILSSYLKREESKVLYKYVINNSSREILTNLESIVYLTNQIPDMKKDASFKLKYKNETKQIDLNNKTFSMFIRENELEDIEFSNVEGDIELSLSREISVKDLEKESENDIKLTRRYLPNKDINQSDLVKVTLVPEFKEESLEGYYEITDIVPAGFRYIKSEYRDNNTSYPRDVNGQKLIFGVYYDKKNRPKYIEYYVKAVLPGTYILDNAMIKHIDSNSMGFTEREEIIIND